MQTEIFQNSDILGTLDGLRMRSWAEVNMLICGGSTLIFDKSGSGPCLQDRGERLSRWRWGLKLIGKCWRDRSVDSKREWLTLSCCPHWQAEHDNGDWGKGSRDLSQGINHIASIKRYECPLLVVGFQPYNMIFHFWDTLFMLDLGLFNIFF